MIKGASRLYLIAIVVALFSMGVSFGLTNYFSFLTGLENIGRGVRLSQAPPQPQHPDIVIVAITEDTLAQFSYRSPVDRAFLAKLLKTLQAKGARAIGLDVLLDQPTDPKKDRVLFETLRKLKVPIAISYTKAGSIVNETQAAYLDYFVPPETRAWPHLATDPFDGVVRWMPPGESGPGIPLSFSRKLAQLVGVPTPARQIAIQWRARPDPATPAFAQYPAHAIEWLPDEWFRGKIVLVGAVLSMTDRHRTPYSVIDDGDDGRMPGIVVQAHSLSQLLQGMTDGRTGRPLDLAAIALFAFIGAGLGLLRWGVVFSFLCGLEILLVWWLGAIVGYAHGIPLVPLMGPTLSLALALWMIDSILGAGERRTRQFVQAAFSRYVSPVVVEQLVANPQALSVHGTRREVSFIFTDIADFTSLSEKLEPERVSEILNAYLDGACRIILEHGGTIDKFIGDAVMSVFNAPIAVPNHVERALGCAFALDAYAERFRADQTARGVSFGVTRIGLHTGMAVVGNFGSQQRLDFTALGDVVNVASRVEEANRYLGTRLCCTGEVVAACPGQSFLKIGPALLKGKQQTVELFQPLPKMKLAALSAYALLDAMPVIERGGEEALSMLIELKLRYPEDPLIRFQMLRAREGTLGRAIMIDA